jgi:hypothetical protein
MVPAVTVLAVDCHTELAADEVSDRAYIGRIGRPAAGHAQRIAGRRGASPGAISGTSAALSPVGYSGLVGQPTGFKTRAERSA